MNLLIKDNFFSNPDVLRRFALDCDYIDSEEVKVDVGGRGYRTDEFEVVGNKHLITASEKVRQAVCCLLYTSPSPRDRTRSRMPSSA